MEPITIERVGQELRAQYINSQKRKEKISASIILLKYYVKQQCRNTLKHTMHIWKHNCTKIKCSIAKTSNTMYNSSIMNDILRKKMEKRQDRQDRNKTHTSSTISTFITPSVESQVWVLDNNQQELLVRRNHDLMFL